MAEPDEPEEARRQQARELTTMWRHLLTRRRNGEPMDGQADIEIEFDELLRRGYSQEELSDALWADKRDRDQWFSEFKKGLPKEPGLLTPEAIKRRQRLQKREELEYNIASCNDKIARLDAEGKEHPKTDEMLAYYQKCLAQLDAQDVIREVAMPALKALAKPVAEFALHIPSWPALEPAAYQGLAGDIVRRFEPQTEADPVSVLMQTLVCYGNVIGRARYWQTGGDVHHCNLFAVIVGKTAKARKGTSWSLVRRLFEKVDAEWALKRVDSGLYTSEGLIKAVRDATTEQEVLRDNQGKVTGTQIVEKDPGVQDKRLLALETEFASVLKRMDGRANTLSPLLRQAWDMGNLHTLTANDPGRATGAHVSLIGHITEDELRRCLNSTEQSNGLGNRILWVASRRSKKLPDGGRLPAMDDLVGRLSAAVAFGGEGGEIRFDDEARAHWFKVYDWLSEGKPGLAGSMVARAEAQVRRLATIYALMDCSHVTKLVHLQAALAVQDYVEATVRYVFGDSLGNPLADEIHAVLLNKSEGLSRTELHELFSRNRSRRELGQALGLLLELGMARQETEPSDGQPGRPPERFYAGKTSYEHTKETNKYPP